MQGEGGERKRILNRQKNGKNQKPQGKQTIKKKSPVSDAQGPAGTAERAAHRTEEGSFVGYMSRELAVAITRSRFRRYKGAIVSLLVEIL